MRQVLISMVVLLYSSLSFGADWKELKYGHEIDIASIETIKPGIKRYWFKSYMSENEFHRVKLDAVVSFAEYAFDMMQVEVNCKKRLARTGKIITYSKAGEPVASKDSGWFEYSEIVPSSMLEADSQYVCADKKTRAKTEFVSRVTPQQETLTDFDTDAAYVRQLNLHCPDWAAIRVNPDFIAYLQQEVPFTRTKIRDALNKADKERDAPKVAEIYNAYKERNRTDPQLQAIADEAYKIYPFLDHTKNYANEAAIEAVRARTKELIEQGSPTAKALRQAIMEIAPSYATKGKPAI